MCNEKNSVGRFLDCVVSMTIKAKMRKYALKHGPEWLQPQMKDPMPYSTVHAMLILCLHTAWSTVLQTPEATQSLKALIHTMAETAKQGCARQK